MRALLLATALIACASIASAQETPAPEPTTPEQAAVATPLPAAVPSRERPPVTTDEGGLWGISDRAEQSARQSGQLESDATLNAYLREISCRVASGYCGDIRLYVMNRPYFNASMAPNGYMEVWSGLLLRVEDEAQLAFVLGHEIGHYSERHSLAQLRTIRSRANIAMVLSIAASAAGAGYIGDLVYLGTLASVYGFSREKETEADMIGFDAAVTAGYDPNAGHLLWTGLIGETRASDNPDTRRRETRGSIFQTHPLSADRIENLQRRAEQRSGEGQTSRERYRAAIRPHLDAWLRADLRRRDYGQTLYILDRLGAHGEDMGVVEYYRGEIYRLRRGEGDLASAKTRYIAALTYADVPAAAWRELGDINAREGNQAEAAENFRFYLEKAPNAEDRALIEARLAQLTGGGQ